MLLLLYVWASGSARPNQVSQSIFQVRSNIITFCSQRRKSYALMTAENDREDVNCMTWHVRFSWNSQAQSMPNIINLISLNAPFHDQRELNKALQPHTVSSWKTHEKPSDSRGNEINFQCFLSKVSLALSCNTLVCLDQRDPYIQLLCVWRWSFDEITDVNVDAINADDAADASDAVAKVAWMILSSSAFWVVKKS